jgi:hypothetical protein
MSGVYAGVGSAINNPAHMIVVENLTDTDVFGSFDGLTDNFYIPAGQARIYDFTSNQAQVSGFYLAQGSRLYVKDNGTPASSGAVYFEVVYAADSV